jgi:hypothetical protein
LRNAKGRGLRRLSRRSRLPHGQRADLLETDHSAEGTASSCPKGGSEMTEQEAINKREKLIASVDANIQSVTRLKEAGKISARKANSIIKEAKAFRQHLSEGGFWPGL